MGKCECDDEDAAEDGWEYGAAGACDDPRVDDSVLEKLPDENDSMHESFQLLIDWLDNLHEVSHRKVVCARIEHDPTTALARKGNARF